MGLKVIRRTVRGFAKISDRSRYWKTLRRGSDYERHGRFPSVRRILIQSYRIRCFGGHRDSRAESEVKFRVRTGLEDLEFPTYSVSKHVRASSPMVRGRSGSIRTNLVLPFVNDHVRRMMEQLLPVCAGRSRNETNSRLFERKDRASRIVRTRGNRNSEP